MAKQDRTTLKADITAKIDDNGVGGITAAELRSILENMADSMHMDDDMDTTNVREYDAANSYNTGDLVTQYSGIWQCTGTAVTGDFDFGEWLSVSESMIKVDVASADILDLHNTDFEILPVMPAGRRIILIDAFYETDSGTSYTNNARLNLGSANEAFAITQNDHGYFLVLKSYSGVATGALFLDAAAALTGGTADMEFFASFRVIAG